MKPRYQLCQWKRQQRHWSIHLCYVRQLLHRYISLRRRIQSKLEGNLHQSGNQDCPWLHSSLHLSCPRPDRLRLERQQLDNATKEFHKRQPDHDRCTKAWFRRQSLAASWAHIYRITSQSEYWLEPTVWRRSNQKASAHVYFSPMSVGCRPIGRPTVGRQSTDSRSTYRPAVYGLPTESRPTVGRPIGRQLSDCRSTRSQPTVGRRSTDSRRVGFRQKSFSTISRMKQGLVFLVELAQTPDSTVFVSKPVLMSHWKAREWLRCGQVTRVLSWANFGGVALYSKIIRCWSQTDLSLIQKEHSKPASSFPVFATQVGKPIEI